LEQIEPERRPSAEAPDTSANTNTNSTGTNIAILSTNGSNVISVSTNQALATTANETNSRAQTATKAKKALKAALSGATVVPAKHNSHVALWTTLFVISLVGLGLMIASDVSHYFGNKALKVLYNDEGEGQPKAPEYDKAEEVWANGQH